MTADSTTKQATHSLQDGFTDRARAMWATGDFARVAARLVLVGELLCGSVDVHAGERVLDVAAGSGNTAISAARRGARVTASDFVEPLLETAQARAKIEGLSLATAVADAQELPFADESFDVVLSTFGAMFARDQQRAADELVRVCRPGGRIGLASWVPDGLMAANQALVQQHVPPPPAVVAMPRPVEWGDEDRLRALFGNTVSELRTERRVIELFASSAAELVEFNRNWFGPTRAAFAQLDEAGQASLAADLTAVLERFNRATDGTLVAQAEYLEVVGVRA
jgi:2-polyprenyl-3-methyl-5-hydroxy-6-metoxy-1,4-benzoquinol methylase